MSVMFGREIDVTINIHQLNSNAKFVREPDIEKETKFNLNVNNVTFGALIVVKDMGSDDKVDLLLKTADDNLSLFEGDSDRLLLRKARKLKLKLPKNPKMVDVFQLPTKELFWYETKIN